MEYVLNHSTDFQAKSEHTEQVKIENTELRMRVNELEAQLHDVTLKYEETKTRERITGEAFSRFLLFAATRE